MAKCLCFLMPPSPPLPSLGVTRGLSGLTPAQNKRTINPPVLIPARTKPSQGSRLGQTLVVEGSCGRGAALGCSPAASLPPPIQNPFHSRSATPVSHGALPAPLPRWQGWGVILELRTLQGQAAEPSPALGTRPTPPAGQGILSSQLSTSAVKNPLHPHIYKAQYLQNGPVNLNCSSPKANKAALRS